MEEKEAAMSNDKVYNSPVYRERRLSPHQASNLDHTSPSPYLTVSYEIRGDMTFSHKVQSFLL
jgi:hypothetical protein